MLARILPYTTLLVLVAAWDCKVDLEGRQYDLSPLDGVKTFESSFSTPPTTTKNVLTLSLCSPLPDPANAEDDCPKGTQLCLKTFSTRQGLDDRLISVVPVAGDIGKGPLETTAAKGASDNEWTLTLNGGEYNGVRQDVEIRFTCDPNAVQEPAFGDYDSRQGHLTMRWQTKEACPRDASSPPPPEAPDNDQPPPSRSSSGMGFFGWLFTIIILSFLSYLALGYYNNWSNYGATGWDALPHKDLWRELPYMIGDLFRGRGSASRNGYNAI